MEGRGDGERRVSDAGREGRGGERGRGGGNGGSGIRVSHGERGEKGQVRWRKSRKKRRRWSKKIKRATRSWGVLIQGAMLIYNTITLLVARIRINTFYSSITVLKQK